MVTKEEFLAYEEVRESGETNMFLTQNVIRLAKEMSGVVLGKGTVIEIMHNYVVLLQKYCPDCNGTGEVAVMGQVYPAEPHQALINTEPCIRCRGLKD